MRREINLEDSETHIVLLALAKLSLDRPGWKEAISEMLFRFPCGSKDIYAGYREVNSDIAPSMIAETCAKIVETCLPQPKPCEDVLKVAVEEIRRYASDLARFEPNKKAAAPGEKLKSWEEIAEGVIVTSLPASDIVNASNDRRTKKATALQSRIVKALKEAFLRGKEEANKIPGTPR